MSKYKVIYIDNDTQDMETIGVFKTLEEASEEGYNYACDELDADFDGDEKEDVINALESRYFYVCGYGDSTIEIEEIV